jgi:hypothetical protein
MPNNQADKVKIRDSTNKMVRFKYVKLTKTNVSTQLTCKIQ